MYVCMYVCMYEKILGARLFIEHVVSRYICILQFVES